MASNLGDKFSTLHEIVRAARNNLAPGPWDYLIGGAETETTVRRNRLALDSIAFRPRVLRLLRPAREHSRHAGADRLDRDLRRGRWRHGCKGVRGVRRAPDAQLRLQ